MSTRIIEKELTWCRSITASTLTEGGYHIECGDSGNNIIRGIYAGKTKQRMLYPPVVIVEMAPITTQVTRVGLSFPTRWRLLFSPATIWIIIGMVPFITSLFLLSFLTTLKWFAVAASFGWCVYWVIWRCSLPANAIGTHIEKMENLLWERLDPKGAASHEIALASLGDVSIWRTIKWISLFLGVLCGLLAIINKLFPYRGFALGLRSDVRLGTILLHRLLDVPRIAGTWGNLFLSFLCGLALIISGWQTSSLTLPHRYHWKCRFYGTYLIWCTAAWLPALMLAVGASKDFFVPVRYSSQLFSILRTMSVMVILFFQGLYVSMVLRMLPGYERPKKQEDYYTPPSARYEVLSEKSIGDDIDLLVTRYKSWTWASFLVFTVLYYLAAAYLIITMVETTDAILGQSWALDSSWRWPLLLPAEGRGAALQSLLLTSLMSCPLAVTVVQAVRAKLRLSKRVALSREFARGFEKLGLPDGPIENLKQSLKTEFIQVALIPVSGINIQIERTAIFKRKYLLWVSAGAQKTLSKGEMEALLWHECGHTALLKRTSWRHLLAIVAPASARFVDLAEDLYEEERKADIHAVRQMGTAYHLLSALKKAREQQSIASEPDIAVENQQAKWATTEHVRMVWNYGWAAYLHPDLDQRIRWLEERSQMVVEHGQAV